MVKDLRSSDLRAMMGSPGACAAVRANRIASAIHILVVALSVAATVSLMMGGTWKPVGLGAVGMMLTAFRQRNTLGLLGKVLWYGLSPGMRALLLLSVVLSLISVGAGATVAYFRSSVSPRVLTVLLGITVVSSLVKMLVLYRGIVNSESAYLAAVTSAANRVASRDSITRLKASLAN